MLIGMKHLNAINMLEDKYNWLRSINPKKYIFNGREIKDFNKTLKQLKIDENSDIFILS